MNKTQEWVDQLKCVKNLWPWKAHIDFFRKFTILIRSCLILANDNIESLALLKQFLLHNWNIAFTVIKTYVIP